MNYSLIKKQLEHPLLWAKGGATITIAMVLISSFFFSCEEIGPIIDLTGTFNADTTYVATEVESPQIKNVLLEEFTGVKCVNCPKGHEILDDLESQYTSRFIAVSVHSKFQSDPYDNDPDLNNPYADSLETFLGPIPAKPSGSIDRKKFPGDDLVLLTSKWVNDVNQQMALSTPVNINITVEYIQVTRAATATITLHHTSEDTLDSRLTVMLLEDNITTLQLDVTGIDSNYVQDRVLRMTLPSTSGMPLNITRERGRVIVRSFNINLPDDWKDENLRIIAFVHRSGSSKEVIQVAQEKIKQ